MSIYKDLTFGALIFDEYELQNLNLHNIAVLKLMRYTIQVFKINVKPFPFYLYPFPDYTD